MNRGIANKLPQWALMHIVIQTQMQKLHDYVYTNSRFLAI
jgi:hypothetical protein